MRANLPEIAQTYCFPARLSKAGHERLGVLLEQHRQLYNAALQERRGAWAHSRSSVSFKQQSVELTGIRKDDPEWAGQDRRMAIETLKRLQKAYSRFYANLKAGIPPWKAGLPRYRPPHRFRTLEIYAGANNYLCKDKRDEKYGRYHLEIKGCPAIRFRVNRKFGALAKGCLPEGQPETIRIVRKARRVEVQLVYMAEAPEPTEPTGEGVGIDVGVSKQTTDSAGGRSEQRTIDRGRLNRLNRRMASLREKAKASGRAEWQPIPRKSGKPKFRLHWNGGESRQYRNIRNFYRKEWERITGQERSATHRLTADIIAGLAPGDTVSVENLRIQNLLKNHRLARVISEQGWGILIRQLEYKAARAGLRFVKVDPRNTSQECSGCGEVVPKKLNVRVHACPHCGLVLDRDENAAINILRRAVFGDTAGANSNPTRRAPGGAQDVYQPPGLPGVAAKIRPKRGPTRPVQLSLFHD